jgi:hypothetical protein
MRHLECEYAISLLPEAIYHRSGIELFEREGGPNWSRGPARCKRRTRPSGRTPFAISASQASSPRS